MFVHSNDCDKLHASDGKESNMHVDYMFNLFTFSAGANFILDRTDPPLSALSLACVSANSPFMSIN